MPTTISGTPATAPSRASGPHLQPYAGAEWATRLALATRPQLQLIAQLAIERDPRREPLRWESAAGLLAQQLLADAPTEQQLRAVQRGRLQPLARQLRHGRVPVKNPAEFFRLGLHAILDAGPP